MLEGNIQLPTTTDEYPNQVTLMINFLIIDCLSIYIIIINHLTLNLMRVVPSTYHLKMKFPTESSVGVIHCDQYDLRQLYSSALKSKLTSEVFSNHIRRSISS